MPTFAESLRPALASARGIAGALGLHPHAVSVEAGTWTGASHTGDRTETLSATAILEDGQNPKVRWLTDEQVALSESGATVEIGPLTPKHAIGGVELATLTGAALTTGQTLYIRITGTKHPAPGKRYLVTKVICNSALHYMLQGKPA